MSERRENDEGVHSASPAADGLRPRSEPLEIQVERLAARVEGLAAEVARLGVALGDQQKTRPGRPLATHSSMTPANRGGAIGSPVYSDADAAGSVPGAISRSAALWDWESLVGARVLNRVGAVALLCALAFFFKLAASRGWITAEARVGIGVLVGAACLACGEMSRRRGLALYAQGLTGGGFALLYVSCFASFGYYHLISDTTAFGALAVITVVTMGWAVHTRAETVAVLGVIGGFLTPILLSPTHPSSGGTAERLFLYLWIIAAGAVAASLYRRWNILLVSSLCFSQWFLLVWLLQNYRASLLDEVLEVGAAFFGLFFGATAMPLFTGRGTGAVRLAVVENAAAFMVLLLSYLSLLDAGWAALLLSVIYGGCAGAASQSGAKERDETVVPFLAVGVSLLTMAISLLASRDIRMAGWGVEAITLLWFGISCNNRALRIAAYPVFAVVAIALIYNVLIWIAAAMVAGSNPAAEFSARVEIPCALFAALTGGATWMTEIGRYSLPTDEQWAPLCAASAVHIVLFVWLSLEVVQAGGGRLDSISPWLSAVWTLYAAVLIVIGVFFRRSMERLWALGVLAIVVAKVFLVDIWSLDHFYRIVSLLCLAAALLGASYLYARFRGRIREIVGR